MAPYQRRGGLLGGARERRADRGAAEADVEGGGGSGDGGGERSRAIRGGKSCRRGEGINASTVGLEMSMGYLCYWKRVSDLDSKS